jgi:hypothetical protein
MELASAVEVVLHVAGSSNHLRIPLRRPQFCAAGMGDDSLEQDLPSWRSWRRVRLLGRPTTRRGFHKGWILSAVA